MAPSQWSKTKVAAKSSVLAAPCKDAAVVCETGLPRSLVLGKEKVLTTNQLEARSSADFARESQIYQYRLANYTLKDGTTENDPAMALRGAASKCKTALIVGRHSVT